MNFKREDKKPLFLLLFCVLSFLAGAVNGFLGTGGGIISYEEKKQIDFGLLFKIVPLGLIGGALGAFLTNKFKPWILNVIFAFLIIYSGLCMILR